MSIDFDRVAPQVLVGSYPEDLADIQSLGKEQRVSAVLNLQTDEDYGRLECDWPRLAAAYQRLNIEVRRVPIRDFDSEDLTRGLSAAVAALAELIDAGHTVYVHCSAGLGRSPSVVIAYLHWIQGLDLDAASEQVNKCHACVPNLEAIRRAIPIPRR